MPRCVTVTDMADTVRRESISTRWDDDEINPVRALAAQETEGNVSQMIRKLVREALATRNRKGPAA